MMRRHGLAPATLALLLLAGCIELPTLRQPKLELPVASRSSTAPNLAPEWWKAYGDPALNALVDEALTHNSNLQLAVARIAEARGNAGISHSQQQPQLAVTADASRSRRSQRGSAVIPGSPVNNDFGAQFEARYELDLWGRLKHTNQANQARLLASEFARDSVKLALSHAVTVAWFNLRTLDAQRTVLQETRANRADALALHTLREKSGLTSALTLRQAEAELADLDVRLAQNSQARQQQALALSTLAGQSPRALVENSSKSDKSTPAPSPDLARLLAAASIPAELPADLLQRRPDLFEAEQTLAAAQAQMQAVKAGVYPSISLTATLGSESARLSDLFSGPAAIWSLGASVAQSLFNGGRTEATLQAEDARQWQAVITYETRVREAFREVLDALITHRQAREWLDAEAQRETVLQQAEALAQARYAAGIENHLVVLDAQRSLLSARLSRMAAQQAQLIASADLAKTLGGGWKKP